MEQAVKGAEPPLCPDLPKASHKESISFENGVIIASGIVAARISNSCFANDCVFVIFLNGSPLHQKVLMKNYFLITS